MRGSRAVPQPQDSRPAHWPHCVRYGGDSLEYQGIIVACDLLIGCFHSISNSSIKTTRIFHRRHVTRRLTPSLCDFRARPSKHQLPFRRGRHPAALMPSQQIMRPARLKEEHDRTRSRYFVRYMQVISLPNDREIDGFISFQDV